jgi:DNA-binding NarL/FixJ family response regulator
MYVDGNQIPEGTSRKASSPRTAVVVLHDAPAYRYGLASGLSQAGFAVREASEVAMVTGDWDACLMKFTSTQGAEALSSLRDRGPVVALLTEPTPANYQLALRCGAAGVASQTDSVPDIIRVLRAALAGKALLPVDVARALAVGGIVTPEASHLSDQAVEWLRSLSRGASVSAIAQDAGYSDRQMYRLLQQLYRSIGAHNREEAIVIATRLGIVTAD